MPNPLINNVAPARQQPGQTNPLQFMGRFMQNPLGALRASGYSIPNGMSDPRQIADHLIFSGQLGRGKLGQLQQMARFIGKR